MYGNRYLCLHIGNGHRFEFSITILNVLDQIPLMLHKCGTEIIHRTKKKKSEINFLCDLGKGTFSFREFVLYSVVKAAWIDRQFSILVYQQPSNQSHSHDRHNILLAC